MSSAPFKTGPNSPEQSVTKKKNERKRERVKKTGKKVVEKTKKALNRVFTTDNPREVQSNFKPETQQMMSQAMEIKPMNSVSKSPVRTKKGVMKFDELVENDQSGIGSLSSSLQMQASKSNSKPKPNNNSKAKKEPGFFKRMNKRIKERIVGTPEVEVEEKRPPKNPPIYKKPEGRKLRRGSLPENVYKKCRTMQAGGLPPEAIEHYLTRDGFHPSCFFNKENKLQKLIENALKNEETAPYGRSKLMIVGKGRAGKTSLIKCMLGKEFDQTEASTKGFDVSRVTASNWKEDNDGYLAEHLAKLVDVNKKSIVEEDVMPEVSEAEPKMVDRAKSMRKVEAEKLDDLRDNVKVEVADEEVKRYGMEFNLKADKGDNLAFSIWDFGGQKAFYSLHHLFLTQYGCYLLVFNALELLNPAKKQEEVEYLKFWLFSKKIHASLAPILLVATHFDEVSTEQGQEINQIIVKEVLGKNSFGEYAKGNLSFFPVDNKTAFGVGEVRKAIEKVVKSQDYIKTCIPVSYLRMIELLSESERDYLNINEAREIVKKCGLDDHFFEAALCFLSQRGLITYFNDHESLRKFVILQPQWLISAITDVVYDEEEHKHPEFDPSFSRDFRKFNEERVLTAGLLENIWTKKGYSHEVQQFLMTVMRRSSLMCQYDFDAVKSFLIPNLFTTSLEASCNDNESEYNGMYFIIDFSGNYDAEIVKDDGRVFVRYMPYGFFERLVCLCVELSAVFHDSIKPEIGDKFARLSFGTEIDFEIRIAENEAGFPLWIKISAEDDAKMSVVRDLVHKIISMTEGLRVDFFSGDSGKSELASTLLVPSTKETGKVLVAYKDIEKAFNKKKKPKKIRPSKISKKKIALKAYNHWFFDAEGDKHSNLLQDEEIPLEKQIAVKASDNAELTLPESLDYHCFLSYKQSSAIDLVGKQYYVLSNLGYKCWYDMKQEGDINLQNMMEGIQKSMCYILILSEDIFPSYYVEEEVKMALKLNKPILFLHHPRTGSVGYWDFGDYIKNSPDIVKPLFEKVESIQIQRRHYLEAAVNKLIDSRLKTIYSKLEN